MHTMCKIYLYIYLDGEKYGVAKFRIKKTFISSFINRRLWFHVLANQSYLFLDKIYGIEECVACYLLFVEAESSCLTRVIHNIWWVCQSPAEQQYNLRFLGREKIFVRPTKVTYISSKLLNRHMLCFFPIIKGNFV